MPGSRFNGATAVGARSPSSYVPFPTNSSSRPPSNFGHLRDSTGISRQVRGHASQYAPPRAHGSYKAPPPPPPATYTRGGIEPVARIYPNNPGYQPPPSKYDPAPPYGRASKPTLPRPALRPRPAPQPRPPARAPSAIGGSSWGGTASAGLSGAVTAGVVLAQGGSATDAIAAGVGAGIGAGVGGAVGAAIGTAIAPGVGTAIGSYVGSAIGGYIGGELGSAANNYVQGQDIDANAGVGTRQADELDPGFKTLPAGSYIITGVPRFISGTGGTTNQSTSLATGALKSLRYVDGLSSGEVYINGITADGSNINLNPNQFGGWRASPTIQDASTFEPIVPNNLSRTNGAFSAPSAQDGIVPRTPKELPTTLPAPGRAQPDQRPRTPAQRPTPDVAPVPLPEISPSPQLEPEPNGAPLATPETVPAPTAAPTASPAPQQGILTSPAEFETPTGPVVVPASPETPYQYERKQDGTVELTELEPSEVEQLKNQPEWAKTEQRNNQKNRGLPLIPIPAVLPATGPASLRPIPKPGTRQTVRTQNPLNYNPGSKNFTPPAAPKRPYPSSTGGNCGCNGAILAGQNQIQQQLGAITGVPAPAPGGGTGGGAAGEAVSLAAILAKLNQMQQYAEKAWQATRLQKVLNLLTFLGVMHNVMLLSRDVGETFMYVVSQGLYAVGIRDEEGGFINVEEIVGNSIEGFLRDVLGNDVYENSREAWLKASTILRSANMVIWTIRSIADSTLDLMEWIAENTGKIGNALKRFGVVGDRAYPWMSERAQARNRMRSRFSKLTDTLENAEDRVSSFSVATSGVIEVQDEIGELGDNWSRFKETVLTEPPDPWADNTPVVSEFETGKTAATSPDITSADTARS